LRVVDTQGQNDQDIFPFRKEYCLSAHGFLLVYSVASRQSLDVLTAIYAKLTTLMSSTPPIVLVGNKIDLAGERMVPPEDGAALAAEWGCPFIECSAKLDINVSQTFELLLDEVQRSESGGEERIRCSCPNATPYLPNGTLVTAIINLLFGIFAVIYGISTGISSTTEDASILSYILLGFGILLAISGCLGVLGARRAHKDFLCVYSSMMAIFILLECIALVILLLKLSLLKNSMLYTLIISIFILLYQIFSTTVAFLYQSTLTRGDNNNYVQLPPTSLSNNREEKW
jgi:Ras homolog enriched in brain